MTPKEAFKQATILLNSTRVTPHYEVDSELFEVMYGALERQIPKKPIFEPVGDYETGEMFYYSACCPNCKREIHRYKGGYEVDVKDEQGCCYCLQAIDWSEVEA